MSVDFDGTLCHTEGPFTEIPSGKPYKGVYRALMLLKTNGYDVVVYTARDNERRVWQWLAKHRLDHYVKAVSNKKPKGHAVLFDNAAWRTQTRDDGLLEGVQTWLASEAATQFLQTVSDKIQQYRQAEDVTLTGGVLGPLPTQSKPGEGS